MRASWSVRARLAALPGFPTKAPGAVNYKSGFSTVSSSQPGSSPSFSFVNEAKIELFRVLCLTALSLPFLSLRIPIDPALKQAETLFQAQTLAAWLLSFTFPFGLYGAALGMAGRRE